MAALALSLLLSSPPELHEWTKADTALQTTFILVTAVDWAQTRTNLDDEGWYEKNRLLGRHPSATKIDLYIAGGVLAHTAIAYALPKPWRTMWQLVWIGIEGATVYSNHRVGVRIDW